MRVGSSLVLCILTTTIFSWTHAADVPTPPRPDWCRPGFVCIATDELARDARYKIDLEEEVAILRAKTKRVRWHAGCGVGVVGVVDKDWNGSLAPGGFCGAIYGW